MYEFLLNMWIMRRVTEEKLQEQVTKGRITQAEYDAIKTAPQISE